MSKNIYKIFNTEQKSRKLAYKQFCERWEPVHPKGEDIKQYVIIWGLSEMRFYITRSIMSAAAFIGTLIAVYMLKK